jgi:hypothetical protein
MTSVCLQNSIQITKDVEKALTFEDFSLVSFYFFHMCVKGLPTNLSKGPIITYIRSGLPTLISVENSDLIRGQNVGPIVTPSKHD